MNDSRFSFAIIFGLFAVYEIWLAVTALRLKRARKISFRKTYVKSSDDSYDYAFATAYHIGAAAFAGGIAAMMIFAWS